MSNLKYLIVLYVCFQSELCLSNCYPHDHWIISQYEKADNVNQARIFYDQLTSFIMGVEWLPIEINVPDTISSAMNGLGSMWTTLSDYFQNQNEYASTPRKNRTKTIKSKYGSSPRMISI